MVAQLSSWFRYLEGLLSVLIKPTSFCTRSVMTRLDCPKSAVAIRALAGCKRRGLVGLVVFVPIDFGRLRDQQAGIKFVG